MTQSPKSPQNTSSATLSASDVKCALHADSHSPCIQPAHRQAITQPGNGAHPHLDAAPRHFGEQTCTVCAPEPVNRRAPANVLRGVRPAAEPCIVPAAAGLCAAPGGGERVREDAREERGRDAATLVPHAHGEEARARRGPVGRRGDGDDDGGEGRPGGAVQSVVPLDGSAERVLEDLGEDVLEVDRDVARRVALSGDSNMAEVEDTHAKVAPISPSMTISGLAPSVASLRSLTHEPHMRIMSRGEHAMWTTPRWSVLLSSRSRARDRAMCCSAMRRTEIRLRMASSRNVLICSGVMYREHSWKLRSGAERRHISTDEEGGERVNGTTHPLAMVGMSFAWLCTRASSCVVKRALSSRVATGGCVVRSWKLLRYACRVRATKGFRPTMKGSASREQARMASLRGISVNTYPTEARTDSGVGGLARERRVERVSGRGGCLACSSIEHESSAAESPVPRRPEAVSCACSLRRQTTLARTGRRSANGFRLVARCARPRHRLKEHSDDAIARSSVLGD